MNVRGSVYWSFFSQVVSFVVTLANTLILARLLNPHEFGIFGIAVAAQAVVQIFLSFGISAYVTQRADLTPTALASAFTVNAIVSSIFALVLFGCSFLAEPLLGTAQAGNVLRVLALAALVSIIGFRPTAMLAREMAFKTISLVTLLSVCMTTIVTLSSAVAGASYMSAAWGILAGAILQALAYNLIGMRHVSWRLSFVDARDVFRFGMTMTLLSGSSALAGRLSEIILGRVQGLNALGYYGRATGITAIIQDNIYASGTKISYVKLAEDARTTGDLRPTLLRSLHLIVGLLWPVQIGLAVVAAPVVNLMYGPQWHAAALPLSLLLVAQAVMLMFGMNWEVFTLNGRLSEQARLELARTLVGALIFVICAQISLAAAAGARVAEALFGLFLYRGKIALMIGSQPGEIRRVYIQGAILTLAAVLPAFCMMLAWRWSPSTPLFPLTICILLGMSLWMGSLRILRHPLFDEILLVLRTALQALSRAST